MSQIKWIEQKADDGTLYAWRLAITGEDGSQVYAASVYPAAKAKWNWFVRSTPTHKFSGAGNSILEAKRAASLAAIEAGLL